MRPSRHERTGPTTTTTTTTTTTPAPAGTTASAVPAPSSNGTLPPGTPWETVAQCETGGDWSMTGPVYSGGLGMLLANWAAYGGLSYAPTAGQASPAEQVSVARRVQTPAPFADTPAGGCQGW
jgi:hypothetical protein